MWRSCHGSLRGGGSPHASSVVLRTAGGAFVGSRGSRCGSSSSSSRNIAGGATLVERIAGRHALGLAPGQRVRQGDFLFIRPRHVLTHDNSWAVMAKFAGLTAAAQQQAPGSPGSLAVADPRQPVLALDHNVQDRSAQTLARYASIEQFARRHGLDFHPAGRGIGHQVMIEEGYVQPGWMVVASDSHSNMYGALGCLGTPVVRTDAAGLWATGATWWQVPPVARVTLTGRLRRERGVCGKDVVLALCGLFGRDEVLNHAVEFAGDGVASLSMEERMTIANMTTEWGALAGVFPVDACTVDFLVQRAARLRAKYGGKWGQSSQSQALAPLPPRVLESERIARELQAALQASDSPFVPPSLLLGGEDTGPEGEAETEGGGGWAKELLLDMSKLPPLVAGPNAIKDVQPAAALERQRVPVHKAYIVSCVNSRVGDLAAAAAVLKGHRVASGVELYIAAASSEVEAESRARGDWQALVDAGAIELPSGCGPCVGLGRGLLRDQETAISATNRNFKGRMGSRSAQAFLASPAVVAASALKGHIARPPASAEEEEEAEADEREWLEAAAVLRPGPLQHEDTQDQAASAAAAAASSADIAIVPSFPSRVAGPVVLTPRANIDTDGIYAGKHCYEDLGPEAQARVCMENYDPRFAGLIRAGDILVAGSNFGCGSSREQAATALRACGVRAVVCASANETFKRNALNNALLLVEMPALVRDLTARLAGSAGDAATVRADSVRLSLDFGRAVAVLEGLEDGEGEGVRREYPFTPVGSVAQEIIVAGGLEGWVAWKRRLEQQEQAGAGQLGGMAPAAAAAAAAAMDSSQTRAER